MKNVLIKFIKTAGADNSKDIREIEHFLSTKNVSFCFEDLTVNQNVPLDTDFCILFLDFEDEKEFSLAKDFMDKNKTLKTFALLKKHSKTAFLNAHNLGFCACLNEISDIGDEIFEDISETQEEKEVQNEDEIKITDEISREFAGT